jgi:hypothetical protein
VVIPQNVKKSKNHCTLNCGGHFYSWTGTSTKRCAFPGLGFTTRGRFEEGRMGRAVLFEDLKGEKEAASNVPKKNGTVVGNRGLLEGGAGKEGF